jgi:hypothetical protein
MKGHVMEGQEGVGVSVKQNLSHMELQLLSCSEIIFQEMSAAKIFLVQHSSGMNTAGYCNFSCPYHSPVKVEQIVSKPRNNSSVNITNMVNMINFGVM